MARALTAARKKNTREHKDAERFNCESGETSKRLRRQAKRAERNSWFRFGEAYSAFRDWRPIPAALLSHSVEHVPGPKKYLPTNHPPLTARWLHY